MIRDERIWQYDLISASPSQQVCAKQVLFVVKTILPFIGIVPRQKDIVQPVN